MRYCPTCGTRFSNEAAFCPHDGAATCELEETSSGDDPMLGRVLDGRYRVEEVIGEGGMGIVYRAVHCVLGKTFAVKVLRGDMAKDPDVVQRFMQEAQAATSIGHENIIDISDFGRLPDGSVYFVMEHLEGEALTDFIRRGGSSPLRDALGIIRQIASALGAAHERGIVHRDLKPDNIFLVERGGEAHFVKVLDFGIAKVGGAGSKLTKTGMIFGTPHYMSPEQAAGQTVDQRTDVYALGVIMYEMFTGKVPFDADTFMGILTKHMFEPPVPPGQIAHASLGSVEAVILKALTKKPEARYQGMAELLADLDRVASGGEVDVAGIERILPPGDSAFARGQTSPTSDHDLRAIPGMADRRPRILKVLAALLVAAGVTAAAVALGVSGEPPAPPVVQRRAPPPARRPEPAHAPARPSGPEAGEPPPAPARAIQLTSRPPGAQVLVSGAVVGNTPMALPAPSGEEPRDVELRLGGFEPQVVRMTAATAEAIHVVLRPERRVRPPTRAHHAPPPAIVEPRAPANQVHSSPGHMTPSRPGITSEVVDPWAD